ncbi:hypothetical protein HPB50_019835 [Hyalomma asiaticum]|uniref:Uncharacterized protein n=1 Tax=Hyalomma asiaticum TaxID=266040 RepID=A0ACB7RXR1_HYAAI|nr:hypothetical protein HPB50_019835 [Hyalomma asiaticum]
MMWTTIPSSNSRPELPETFKSAALAAAVARRKQARNALTTASTDAASLATADAGVCSPILSPPASRSAGQKRGKNRPLWTPQPLPKPKATDFVVVLKCRTQLSLAAVFPENGAGRALIAHLGATATRLVTVVLVREQNLMLVYTTNPHIADKLIVGPVPMFGYLRADTQDSCYGVVTVPNSDNEATLREILHVRRLGTSNKVQPRYVSYDALLIPVQPYKKMVPACSRCGSVGHRPDTCPGPKPDLCGICGKAVPLTDGSRAPHECTPRCALCAGPHVTGTGAVRSATGCLHPSRLLLHRGVKLAPGSENVGADGSRGSWTIVLCRRGPSLLPPTLSCPRTLAQGLSGLPYEAQLRTNLRSRGLLRGRLCPHRPNRIRHYLDPSLVPRELIVVQPRPERTPGERLGRGSLCVPTLHDSPTHTASPLQSHL